MSEHYGEFEVSNDSLNNIPLLRSRLREQGYLFFREILDKTALLHIRRDILEKAQQHGIIKDGTAPLDGIFKGGDFPAPARFETSKLYREILDIPSFNAFGTHPLLSVLYSGLLDAEVREHRRRIGRIAFPQSAMNTTSVHQDFFYIKGSVNTYTNWIPTGYCPKALGGLAVLERSNHVGLLPHSPAQGAGGFGIPGEAVEPFGLRWLTTDYRLGDLLLFHSLTIHKALDNVTSDQLRVSLEYRLQSKAEEIDSASLVMHRKVAFDALGQ